jgi:RNA polymerase nonessential primary-like sigma factor
MSQTITYEELDARLDPLAVSPDDFADASEKLAQDLSAQGIDLDIMLPGSWRDEAGPRPNRVASIEEQLRTEIDAIRKMTREEEACLARRIEFARARLQLALEHEGLTDEDLEGAVHYDPTSFQEIEADKCHLPPNVCRRWVELHALRTELVERNLYLVLINVERYAHMNLSRLDLIQEGSAALFRAVDGFDWRRGLLFRTYAVHWLNQAFRSHLYNFGHTVRVPVYLQKAMKHVKQAIERLGDVNASPEEIAVEADLGVNLVESALAATRSTFSMDVPMKGADEGAGLADILGFEQPEGGVYSVDMEDVSLREGIHAAMERLSERERFVVEMRFGIDREREHTLSEVAGELGVSLERVRQIQVRAIKKMQTPGLRKAIDPYL